MINQTKASRAIRRALPKLATEDGVLPRGTVTILAKRYGVSKQRVGQYVKKLGFKSLLGFTAEERFEREAAANGRKLYAKVLREAARRARAENASRLWKAGASVDQIAEALGVANWQTAHQFINKWRKIDMSLFPYRKICSRSRLNVPLNRRRKKAVETQPVA